MTDCENRTGANRNQRVQVWLEKLFAIRLTGSRLSRLPFREMIKTTQVRGADQALYHHELTVSSLGSVCQSCTAPLLKLNASLLLEALHLFRCFTHTPRCRGAFSEEAWRMQMTILVSWVRINWSKCQRQRNKLLRYYTELRTTWSRDSLVIFIRKVRGEVLWVGFLG